MLGNDHLHIDENDLIADWIVKTMKSATSGTIKIDMENKPAAQIDVSKDKIAVNLLQPAFFRAPDDETGIFDKLPTSKEFARKLTDNGLTLSILRRGKEAITLGNEAKPKLSKLITRSDDMQINSIKEATGLKRDFKADKEEEDDNSLELPKKYD
jgi:hypothetical protein